MQQNIITPIQQEQCCKKNPILQALVDEVNKQNARKELWMDSYPEWADTPSHSDSWQDGD